MCLFIKYWEIFFAFGHKCHVENCLWYHFSKVEEKNSLWIVDSAIWWLHVLSTCRAMVNYAPYCSWHQIWFGLFGIFLLVAVENNHVFFFIIKRGNKYNYSLVCQVYELPSGSKKSFGPSDFVMADANCCYWADNRTSWLILHVEMYGPNLFKRSLFRPSTNFK